MPFDPWYAAYFLVGVLVFVIVLRAILARV